MGLLSHVVRMVRCVLFPTRCPVCSAIGPAPCGACRARLRPAPTLPAPPGVDRLLALFAYDGAGREIVARLKYRNARASAPWLAAQLVALLAGACLPAIDLVTWVPTTAGRRRQRGFDQAELLARRVARRARLPPARLLVHGADHQTGRSAAARRAGVVVLPRRPVPTGAHVLLVDDVVTTGATMSVAGQALRSAGAAAVTAIAVARTPLKGG